MASRILCVARKIIKPSIPTPYSLKRHNLSFMDYINTPAYSPIATFYSKPPNYNISQISHILENSLSKVLSSYYPFAGRIEEKIYVDCNDIGAEYLNVRVNCPMSEVLNNCYNDAIDVVFPQDLPWSSSLSNGRSILVVQLSHFDCGGLAVSVCLSHKIADGYSLLKFLNDWATTARELDFKPSPQFDASSFFPLTDDPPYAPNLITGDPQRHTSRMYHLSSSSLGRLKEIVSTNSEVQNPTRVEVATSLFHKCGVEASMENSGLLKPSLLVHVMNLRPPLSLNTIGNACSFFSSIATTEDEIQVPRFVAQLRKAKQHLREKLKDMSLDQLASQEHEKIKNGTNMLERKCDFYLCSSLCNFGLYKADFGWGRPIRVTLARNAMKNHLLLLDDQSGDGINALITLTNDDMSLFQSNKEILKFASPIFQSRK